MPTFKKMIVVVVTRLKPCKKITIFKGRNPSKAFRQKGEKMFDVQVTMHLSEYCYQDTYHCRGQSVA